MKIIRHSCLWLMALLMAPPALAILPEPGMYWDPRHPGRGYYIDVQEGIAFLVIYAFDEETGQAEIYVADGELRDDGIDMGFTILIHPPPNPEGYFPLHWFIGDLYRVEDGPCLTCGKSGIGFKTEKVGTVAAWFPEINLAWVAVHLVEGNLAFDALLERMNWGRARMVGTAGSSNNPPLLFHDVRGQWVFVDQSDPDASPWRFDFDRREPDSNELGDEIIYFDTQRGAEFRCTFLMPADQIKLNGCELHWNGEVLFSAALSDIGVNRVHAFRGELPPMITPPPLPQPEFHRGPDTVIGLRIEMPPPEDEEDGDPDP